MRAGIFTRTYWRCTSDSCTTLVFAATAISIISLFGWVAAVARQVSGKRDLNRTIVATIAAKTLVELNSMTREDQGLNHA